MTNEVLVSFFHSSATQLVVRGPESAFIPRWICVKTYFILLREPILKGTFVVGDYDALKFILLHKCITYDSLS
jgi:hypothetical protein